MTYPIAYLGTLIVFFIIDMIWLAGIARNFYAEQLAGLMGRPKWGVAIVFYCIYVAGIVFFAVRPALDAQSLMTAIMLGAALGFLCYATYDLTNLATLKGWPVKMVIVDIIWGTVLTASCAAGGYLITQALTNPS